MTGKSLLVPTDLSRASDGAAKQAHDLAVALGARLVLVHVVDGHVMMPAELWRPPTAEERAARDAPAMKQLRRIAERLPHDVPIECVIEHGDPREEIPRLARDPRVELVVMTRPSHFLGSIVETIVRDTDVPVLVAAREEA